MADIIKPAPSPDQEVLVPEVMTPEALARPDIVEVVVTDISTGAGSLPHLYQKVVAAAIEQADEAGNLLIF